MYDCDLNKRVLDSLIRSGSFDSMGYRRSQLLAVYEQVVDALPGTAEKIWRASLTYSVVVETLRRSQIWFCQMWRSFRPAI